MDLHPDGVTIPFLRGVHIRIPLLLPILGGRKGVDDDDVGGSLGESQPLLFEMSVDLLKDSFSQAVDFERGNEICRCWSRRGRVRFRGRIRRNVSLIQCRKELLQPPGRRD